MKLKKTISGVLAVTTLLLGSLSTLGNASAFSVESKDTPAASGAVAPEQSGRTDSSSEAEATYGLCSDISDGVILHAWCWSFETISANMKNIADAGYSAVQTSPVNMVNGEQYNNNVLMGTDTTWGTDGAWWWQYQPIDFKVDNFQFKNNNNLDPGNTLSDYKDMCDVAHSYGIKIITDVVLNHTAKNYTTVSDDLLTAVGIKTNPRPAESSTEWYKLYHENWNATSYTVNNVTATGRLKDTMWNLECGTSGTSPEELHSTPGLRDLNTENPKIQEYMLNYMNDLVDAGCDGFRFDTTKHIAVPSESDLMGQYNKDQGYTTDFWPVMTGQKSVNGVSLHDKDNLFLYGEILDGSNIPYAEYADYVKITADVYGKTVRNDLTTPNINRNSLREITVSNATTLSESEKTKVIDNGLITWVESHDTYCNNNESASLTENQINYGWAMIAARKTGTPLFFSRPNNSSSSNIWGNNQVGAIGNGQFKSVTISNVNKFRNQMSKYGADSEWLRNPVSGSSSNDSTTALQIDRYKSTDNTTDTCGTCIINMSTSSLNLNGRPTALADGEYTDTISGNIFVVSGGNFTSGTVNAGAVATIYNTENEPEQEETIPDEDTNFDDYRYTYFFNSCAWTGSMTATLTDDSGNVTRTLPLTYSDDLHCYYCKYPSSGYTKITFNVGSNSTTQQTINPGMVFVPTSKYNNQDEVLDGEWISISNIIEHTIYFKHNTGSGSFGTNAYVYLYTENTGSPTLMNAAWPGVAMTKTKKLYNGSYVADDFCYSYTYYYPKLTNSDIDDYAKVIFNNNDTKQSRDEDSAMPESNGINCFTLGGYSNGDLKTRYYLTSSDLSTTKTVSVEIDYYSQKVADSASEATFTKGNLLSTTTTASVTNGDVASGISTACTNMHMTNLYDKFTFYGSQFAYVKALASDIDSRLSTTEPRAAFINPANLAKPSTAFSGVYSDSENVLTDISSESEKDWVEYYYEDKDNNVTKTKVDFTQVNPELSNLTSIKVNAFYLPRTYTVIFDINDTVISETCSYNQLLSETTQNSIKSAIDSTGETFDGWYIKDGTKELKISSEPDYKYRITQSRTLYAKFRTDDRPAHKATAIADPIDVFSENGTTMYRYNTLLNICDLGDSDSNISQVGIVYVKPNDGYSVSTIGNDIQSHISSIDSYTPTNYTILKSAVYNVGDGTTNTVTLTTKNRLQFNLKLTQAQATDEGKYANVLAYTVYNYNGTWHVSENCVHYTGRTFTEIE